MENNTSTDVDKLITFGQMALEQGWYDQAHDYFEQALTLDASNREAMKGLARANEILSRKAAMAVEPMQDRPVKLPSKVERKRRILEKKREGQERSLTQWFKRQSRRSRIAILAGVPLLFLCLCAGLADMINPAPDATPMLIPTATPASTDALLPTPELDPSYIAPETDLIRIFYDEEGHLTYEHVDPDSPHPPPVAQFTARSCCKICRKGKACGDSCIASNKKCHKPPGCACNVPSYPDEEKKPIPTATVEDIKNLNPGEHLLLTDGPCGNPVEFWFSMSGHTSMLYEEAECSSDERREFDNRVHEAIMARLIELRIITLATPTSTPVPTPTETPILGNWISPYAVYNKCGEEAGHPATAFIDGNTATYWEHHADSEHGSLHWIIVDLGASYYVQRIRIYVGSVGDSDWDSVKIYISQNTTTWGTAVAQGVSFAGTNEWRELDLGANEKAGRYMKLENIDSRISSGSACGYEVEAFVR